MIVSYRNNTSLIRKKRLFKSGKSYFHSKEAYRKAAGGELAFRTATPKERALIRSKIRKEYLREKLFLVFIYAVVFSIAIWITVAFWPSKPTHKMIHSIGVSNSEYTEFNNYMAEGDRWMVKNKWYNAIYEYDLGYSLILKDHPRISYKGLRLEYINQFENINPADVLRKIDELIIKCPTRIELYKFRAEYLVFTNFPLMAEADYKKIDELTK